jgi:hypothetical protein
MADSPKNKPQNIRQDIDEMRGGNIIGQQINYHGTTPQSHPVEKKRIDTPVLVAIIGGIASVVVALIAIVPPLLPYVIPPTPTPIDTPTITQVVTETATVTLAPSETPLPTETATVTSTLTLTHTATNLPTATQTLTNTNSPILTTATSAVATPGYPCNGQIVFYSSAPLNVVHVAPSSRSSYRNPVQQGSSIRILGREQETLEKAWYEIATTSGNELGWIPAEHVILSESCPPYKDN